MVAPPALFRRPPQYGLDRTRLDLVLLVFLVAYPLIQSQLLDSW